MLKPLEHKHTEEAQASEKISMSYVYTKEEGKDYVTLTQNLVSGKLKRYPPPQKNGSEKQGLKFRT